MDGKPDWVWKDKEVDRGSGNWYSKDLILDSLEFKSWEQRG